MLIAAHRFFFFKEMVVRRWLLRKGNNKLTHRLALVLYELINHRGYDASVNVPIPENPTTMYV